MEETEHFSLGVCDASLKDISENVQLNFPIITFFEMLLKDCLEDDLLEITSYDLIPNSDEIMHLPATSIIKRYYLQGQHGDVQDFKKHLIVKIRNDDPRYIKLGVKILHENEMLAYVKILPLLNDEEFCTVPLPIPKVYYAFKNVIIMEDLNDKSFYFPDKSIKGISSHQCRIILKQLAKFHSHSLVCQMKEPEIFEEVRSQLRENLFYPKQSEILKYKKIFLNKFAEYLETQQHYNNELEDVIKTLRNLEETFVEKIKNLILYPKEHSVICHGDLRATNILIHQNSNEVKFIDFQQVCYSSIARDLITLFYVNLQPRDMRYFMNSFVGSYVKYLHEYLKEQGVDLVKELTEAWLHSELMRFQVYGIVYGLWHSLEFYIENAGVETSLAAECRHKYYTERPEDPKIFERAFAERATEMLKFYKNQTC